MSAEKRTTPSVSLKDSERKYLERQAKKAGISLTNYMRQVALGQRAQAEVGFNKKTRRVTVNEPITPGDLKAALRQLSAIGNNLNQIARHVNTERNIGPGQTEKLKQIRADIEAVGTTILKALR